MKLVVVFSTQQRKMAKDLLQSIHFCLFIQLHCAEAHKTKLCSNAHELQWSYVMVKWERTARQIIRPFEMNAKLQQPVGFCCTTYCFLTFAFQSAIAIYLTIDKKRRRKKNMDSLWTILGLFLKQIFCVRWETKKQTSFHRRQADRAHPQHVTNVQMNTEVICFVWIKSTPRK